MLDNGRIQVAIFSSPRLHSPVLFPLGTLTAERLANETAPFIDFR